MKYRDLFRAKAQEFQQVIDGFRAALNHSGQKGAILEDKLRSYLTEVLPNRLGVTEGIIYSSIGEVSPQCDVIVYDRHHTPVLFNENGTRAIPVECVFAIIEVKTRLSKGDLISFCSVLQTIRAFDRSALYPSPTLTKTFLLDDKPMNFFPILGYMFSMESSSKISGLQEEIQRMLSGTNLSRLPNCVYVSNEGCIAYNGPKTPTSPTPGWISYPNSLSKTARYEGKDAFLLFIVLLMDLLMAAEMYQQLNLVQYFQAESFDITF